MEDKLVSIIVPVYNVENYLEECLNSLINQIYQSIEIICVNDKSTDNSLDILQSFVEKDSRIKIINMEQNSGLSIVRNKGIEESKGDFICFVDSDDFISRDFILDLYLEITKTDSDIAVTNIYETFAKTKLSKPLVEYKESKLVAGTKDKLDLAMLPKHNYVWNKMYRADFLKKSGIRFREDRLYEDIEFTHKIIYLARKVCSSTSAKYFYRQHNSSIVAIKSNKWLEDRDLAWKNTIRFMQSIPTNIGSMRNYDWSEMTDYVIFGILLLRIRICGFYKLYYLFGKLLIFEIRRKVKDYKEGD